VPERTAAVCRQGRPSAGGAARRQGSAGRCRRSTRPLGRRRPRACPMRSSIRALHAGGAPERWAGTVRPGRNRLLRAGRDRIAGDQHPGGEVGQQARATGHHGHGDESDPQQQRVEPGRTGDSGADAAEHGAVTAAPDAPRRG
jgi:hypothetical protein